jgi:DNA-binding NtrC family response regulator
MQTAADRQMVLVVEDDADVRTLLAEYLGVHGLRVMEAENGLEALLRIKHHRPGVVVLDLRMPRLGGLDVLKRIRVFDPSIQVIVITGDTSPETHRLAHDLGAVEVLSKPLDFDRLLRALGLAEDASATAPARPTPAPGRIRILVVDDDVQARTLLEHFLVSWGYQPRSVADGVAALRLISQSPPDLVLLDVDMPGLSGTDALPAIRALAPEARVIMVSGSSSAETSKRALAGGAVDYIVKPVDLDHLARSLETALTLKPTRN